MAAGSFKGQYEDEEVLFVFRKHPVVMRKGLVLASIGLLLPMLYITALTYIYANNPDKLPSVNAFYVALGIGLLLSILLAFPSWIYWYFSVYIVTDKRFIQSTQKGFFNKKVIDLALSQIQMVNYEISGIQETLLGFGTITVQTFVGNLVIHDVHKPAHVQHELLEILRSRGYASNLNTSPQTQQQEQEE